MSFFGKILNYPPAKKVEEENKEKSVSSIQNLDEESFQIFLDKVRNGEFNAAELKKMGFSVSDFKKEWIRNGEISDYDKRSAEKFEESMSEEAEKRGTLLSVMRKAWESPTLRVLVALTVFTGKFGSAHGSEHTVKDAKQNNIESSTNIKSNNDGKDGNYDASPHFAKVEKGGNDNINMAGFKIEKAPIGDFSPDEATKINNDYEHFTKTLKFDNNGNVVENSTVKIAVDENKKIEDLKANIHSDFEKITSSELKAVSVLDIANNFKIDNPHLSEDGLEKVTTEVHKMLSQLKHDNIKTFLDQKKVITVSRSPEPTNYKSPNPAYKTLNETKESSLKKNIPLAVDTVDETIKVINSAVESYDFSKSDLSADEINQLKHMNYERDIPSDGYKKISELPDLNPKTGKTYTDKEAEDLKKSNYEEYMKLSDKCREVKANFMVENKIITEKIIEKIHPMEAQKMLMEIGRTHEMQMKIIDSILHSDHTIILADDSNSMKDLMKQFADNLTKVAKDKGGDSKCDIKLYSFSEEIGGKIQVNSLREAGEKIGHMPTIGGSFERSAHSALEAIKDSKIGEDTGVKTILIGTNEAIKASKNEMDLLVKEAGEKGINIYYVLGNVNHVEGLNVAVIPIEVVKAEFDKIYNNIVSDAVGLIKLNESNLSNKHLIESGYFKHGIVEKMQKETLAKKSEVTNLSETTLRLSSFDVKDDKGNVQGIAMRDYM